MATLTNTKIKDTYDGLLKTTDNDVIDATGVTLIEDGLGNASAISIGRANNGVTITGALIASGLSYPTSDGTTSGQAIVTDGAGNLSFATVTADTPTLDEVTAEGATSSVNVTINGADLGTIVSSSNTLFGDGALDSFTTGSLNVAIGYQALTAATSGSGNTVVGARALDNYTSGTTNTAIGSEALGNGTTLSYNVAVGDDALFYINGSYNVALGHNAGETRTGGGTKSAGDSNIYIGSNTVSAASDTDNEIVIGANAVGNGSNSATYGDSNVTKHIFTAGDVGIGTDTIDAKLHIATTGECKFDLEDTGGQEYRIFTRSSDGIFGIYDKTNPRTWFRHTSNATASNQTLALLETGGNVGIGTSSPNVAMQINQASSAPLLIHRPNNTSFDPHGIVFSTRGDSVDGGLGDARSGIFSDYNGDLFLAAAETGITGSPETYARLFIDGANGRVGIGELSPSRPLHISADTPAIRLEDTTGGDYSELVSVNGDLYIRADEGNTQADSTIRFQIDQSERMRIDSSGNVGIGINPSTNFHLASSFPRFRIEDTDGGYGEILASNGSLLFRSDEGNTQSDSNMRFEIDGSEAMRIDSSGNVGIGTASPSRKLMVEETDGTNNIIGVFKTNNTVSGVISFSDGNSTAGDFGVRCGAVGDNFTVFTNGANERMRIDSSGDVIIKNDSTTSAGPTLRLDAAAKSTWTTSDIIGELDFYTSDTSGNAPYSTAFIQSQNETSGGTLPSGALVFGTASYNAAGGAVERMRITSDGDLRFGGNFTSADPIADRVDGLSIGEGAVGRMKIFTTSNDSLLLGRGGSGDVQEFYYNASGTASSVGSISITSSSTAYNTSSDYRLKENVVEMTGALDRVDALKPSRFNFIADPEKTVDGFLAHEVAEVVPEAVTGEKDAVEEYEVTPAVLDEDGNVIEEAVMGTRPVYQGIDQSKIVPLLVGAIKELRAEIELLKSQING